MTPESTEAMPRLPDTRRPPSAFPPGAGLALALTLCALGSGCEPRPRDGTLGEEGRVEFRFQRSCFFGCPLEQPLLEGARERISLDGPGDGVDVEVSSGDPSILEVAMQRQCFCERGGDGPGRIEIADDASCDAPWDKHCDNEVLVAAHDSGDVSVTLRDDAGELIDRATVHVRPAERARFEAIYADRLGHFEDDPMELGVGETLELELTLYDDDGRELLAPEGVSWRVDDVAVAELDAWLVGRGAEVHTGLSLSLHGVAAGEAEVSIDVPGLSASVGVLVAE